MCFLFPLLFWNEQENKKSRVVCVCVGVWVLHVETLAERLMNPWLFNDASDMKTPLPLASYTQLHPASL
jgi:hypothetical protein